MGVRKTMLLNFFFDNLDKKKQRLHFNEFMIKFHDFKFVNSKKSDVIELFVKEIKKKIQIL